MSTYIEDQDAALKRDREAVTEALTGLSDQAKSMIVQTSEAHPEDVEHVMANEHSDHYWFRLPDGDLILGVYPQGEETYFYAADAAGI